MIPGVVNFQYVAKKYVFELLQEKYEPNQAMIERMAHYLATEKDVTDFCKIIMDAYAKGYSKAVNDYKEQLAKMGYEVNVVTNKN
jgi:hypothetical protein